MQVCNQFLTILPTKEKIYNFFLVDCNFYINFQFKKVDVLTMLF